MRWRKHSDRGFILLEVVPALLLLGAVLLLSIRMVRWRAEMRESGRAQLAAAEAFGALWRAWSDSGGRAAVVRAGVEGLPEVLDFPDSSWLPGLQEAPGGGGSVWRREPGADAGGAMYWDIGYRLPGARAWSWWSRIYDEAGSLQ